MAEALIRQYQIDAGLASSVAAQRNWRLRRRPACADERIAYAAEYAAYRLGRIDQKFGHLIEIMERGTAQSSKA